MKPNTLFIAALCALPATQAVHAKEAPAKKQQKKNIIFLLTDDQSNKSIHALGNLDKVTPNIDKLVHNGVSFMNHYATTSISMASRAQIMTGMYEYKTGCNFQHGPLQKDQFQKSYPVLLRNAGYYTGFAGKFGFAVKDAGDSDYHDDTWDAMPVDQFDEWAGGLQQTKYQTKQNKYIAKYAKKYPHSSRAYGQFGIDFIQHAVDKNKPFCLSISFKAPHRPLTPDKYFDAIYADKHFNKVATYGRNFDSTVPKQAKLGRQYLRYFDQIDVDYDKYQRKYQQLIYGVDYAVGMIVQELERQGLMDNTIIIFSADNGWNFGAHAMSGKVLPYYEASNVPMIVVDPSNKKHSGRRVNAITGNIDVTTTILDYAGVKAPKNMDGVSLRPIVEHKKEAVRDELTLMNAWGTPQSVSLSIVTKEFKYTYWYFGDKMQPSEELYDMVNDPSETNNLVGVASYAKELAAMRKRYDKQVAVWKKECVQRNDYPVFATLYNRHIDWKDKEALIPAALWEGYDTETGKWMKYKGDNRDYDAVIRFAEEQNRSHHNTK